MDLKRFKFLIPVLFTFLIIGWFYFSKFTLLKIYPPTINFLIFMLFFTSIFSKETIIQKFAKAMEGKDLNLPVLKYTRNLTYVWSIFLFFNFMISLLTVFLSDKIWMMYNGFISYVLLGIFFMAEYIVRISFKRKHNV